MRYAHHKLLSAWMLALGLLLLGACRGQPSGTATNAPNNAPTKAPVNRDAAARTGCAAMTDEVAAITGLQLRPPLDISAPNEELLRGCTWAESGGGVGVVELAKEPANQYDEMERKNRTAFPERFKQLEGIADKAYVAPNVSEGWNAYALRGSESFRVEVIAEAATAEQATKLLRLALDRL